MSSDEELWSRRAGVSDELVLPRLLLPVAERNPDRLLTVDADGARTYAQHVDRVRRLGGALGALGVGRHDRFAVLAGNRTEYCELWHAAFFGAGVINPLNIRLAPAELPFILRDSEAKAVFVDAEHAELWRQVAALGVDLPVIALDDASLDGADRYDDLLAAAEPSAMQLPDEDHAVVLMYTGGTTGVPKGVVLSHRAELLNLYHQLIVLGVEPGAVYLHQSPMFHGAAILGLTGPPVTGGTMVCLPRFQAGAMLDAVERHGVTDTQMAPTMIAMLLDSPAFDASRLASLRRLVFGGAPMTAGLFARLRAALPDLALFQGYGMTEVASVLTYLPHVERVPERIRSVGLPVPGVELQVHDPAGERLPTGAVGEICVRAGNVMNGYWRRPDETAAAFRDGWYRTGDAGYVDDDGFVFLVDRLKDMIITGGENVYSIEVEQALSTHAAVSQVAVLGVPDEVWGERVHAVVVLRDGHDATPAELQAHARAAIAGYKVPRSFDLRRAPLPVSGAMKVLKRELLAELVDAG